MGARRGRPHRPLSVRSRIPAIPTAALRRVLEGLPEADGYEVLAVPLRYRRGPHLAAETDFDAKQMVLRLPEPFLPFGEVVRHGAKRTAAKGMRFVWLSEGLTFRTPREVLRFLYLHEWMHWYLKERLGRKSAAETACDRFALRNYRRRRVTIADAEIALRRRST